MRERIANALGTRVSDRKLGDLMRLAHFQMLGREARAWRSPTAILARRPLRRAWVARQLLLAGCRDPQMCAGDPANLAVLVSWHSREPELSARGDRGDVFMATVVLSHRRAWRARSWACGYRSAMTLSKLPCDLDREFT